MVLAPYVMPIKTPTISELWACLLKPKYLVSLYKMLFTLSSILNSFKISNPNSNPVIIIISVIVVLRIVRK